MILTPHDYQEFTAGHAVNLLRGANRGQRWAYSSPPGTGKSVIALLIQQALAGAWIVTPRVEIVAGMLAKLGGPSAGGSAAAVARAGLEARITTPVRLRNLLARGKVRPPSHLIIDEGHHASADVYRQLLLYCDDCPAVLMTATFYRGTRQGTAELRKMVVDHFAIMTFPEAIRRKVCAMPEVTILPLVDDDLIEIRNGEFVVQQVTHATKSRLLALADWCRGCVDGGRWDRPTVLSLPSIEAAALCVQALESAGLPATLVTKDTGHADRQTAFAHTIDRRAALVQINVVSEGVDLPLRRLIDLSPTASPVYWFQQFGRITRPTDTPPEYVCTNRNLQRHCYILEGALPDADVKDAQEAFGGPGKRDGQRVVGLENLGRFKPVELPLAGGLKGTMYAFSAMEGSQVRQYVAICHPAYAEAVWASRTNGVRPDGGRDYGLWRACEAPEDVRGFSSLPPGSLSDKQREWWKRAASRYGLDGTAEVNRKQFPALPILKNLGLKIGR